MTDTKAKKWYHNHLKSLSLPEGDMRLASFKVNGKQVQVPIPESLWQYALRDYNRMADLRRQVMKRVIREIAS